MTSLAHLDELGRSFSQAANRFQAIYSTKHIYIRRSPHHTYAPWRNDECLAYWV